MLKEQIKAVENKLESIEVTIGEYESAVKDLKSDRAVLRRTLKTLKKSEELLSEDVEEDKEHAEIYNMVEKRKETDDGKGYTLTDVNNDVKASKENDKLSE